MRTSGRSASGRRKQASGPVPWSVGVARGLLVAALVGACGHAPATSSAGGDVEARISRLEREEQQRKARLAALEEQIAQAERDLARAREEAEQYACVARRSRIEAKVEVARLECGKRVAEYAECVARNEADATTKTVAGCLFGLAFAMLTGGAATPAVITGCGGGAVASEATKRRCGPLPSCPSDEEARARILREEGLARMPDCRGRFVAELEGSKARSRGLGLIGVGRGRWYAPPRRSSRARGACPRYQLDRIEVAAPRAKRSGAPWDGDGSPPDIVVRFVTDSGARTSTPKKPGYRVVVRPKSRLALRPGEGFGIVVIDKDLVSDDAMASFRGSVDRRYRGGGVTLDNGRTTVRVFFSCDAGT